MNRIISVIIVDDEPTSIEVLKKDLQQYPDIEVISTTSSAEKAKKLILKYRPELLFMDVEMPEMTGFELIESIQDEISPETRVVFYTAYDKYLLDALRASAFDYLLKPYLPEDLEKLMERVKKSVSEESSNLKQSIRRFFTEENRTAIQTVTGLLLLKREDIVMFYFNDSGKCWQIFLSNQTEHKLKSTLSAKDLLHLSDSFVQINQSYIININYLYTIENKSLECKLYPPFDRLQLTASRRCYSKIKEMLDIL